MLEYETRFQESPFLTEFVVGNRQKVSRKIRRFEDAGIEKIHAVFDFDRTLTTGTKDDLDVTTWHILKSHLPDVAQNQYKEYYEKYHKLESANQLGVSGAEEWWGAILALFRDNQLNIRAVENDFLSKVTTRPKTQEVFDMCTKLDIPTVILSAGIKDVIDIWCREHEINPTLVLSTQLQIDDGGTMTGWEEDTLIHVLNKNEQSHNELAGIRLDRPFTVLVGDSMDDARAVLGEEDVLRIRIRDPRNDEEAGVKAFRQETFTKFDLLIETGEFSPLVNGINYFSASK